MKSSHSTYLQTAQRISEHFSSISQIEAIALAGSQTSGTSDNLSDIDLYVYSAESVPLKSRRSMIKQMGANRANLNLSFWDIGDEWIDLETGIEVDLMYWNTVWITSQIDRNLSDHQASVGYSTCFWHTILNSISLFDRSGWFTSLQSRCKTPYPEALRKAIIAKNYPILRNTISSYYSQINKAIKRNDQMSINHRLTALFASYFDILFALNYHTNPGEKRIFEYAISHCSKIPKNFEQDINELLKVQTSEKNNLLSRLNKLFDNLDRLLINEGLDLT